MYSDGTVLYFTSVMGLGLFPQAYNATVLGTFRSNDAEGNENVKLTIVFISKTTT